MSSRLKAVSKWSSELCLVAVILTLIIGRWTHVWWPLLVIFIILLIQGPPDEVDEAAEQYVKE